MKKIYFSFIGTFNGIFVADFVGENIRKHCQMINTIFVNDEFYSVYRITDNLYMVSIIGEENYDFIGRIVSDEINAPIPNPIFN
jgi:hypothetical protein